MGIYLLLLASIDAHSMTEYFNFAYDWQYGKFFFILVLNSRHHSDLSNLSNLSRGLGV